MTELKDLIAQRGRVKTRITLFEKYLTPLLECKLNKSQINELSLRLSKFQDLSYSYDDLQSKIEAFDIDEDKEMRERESYENRFFSLIARSQELLQLYESASKNESASASVSGSDQSKHKPVKLPPLKIPTFSGDPSKWIEFRDMFLSLIHNNDSIEDINKFHYLKSYLSDSASAVINSVTVSSINYPIAWTLLCDRFNNKRLLINEHIKGLFSVEPIAKESEVSLRALVDTITKNLSALNSLGEPTDYWDSLIIYMASAKLDLATARKWEEFRSTLDSVKLSDFFDFLRQRATVLETVHSSKPIKSDKRYQVTKSKSFIISSPSSPSSPSSLNNNNTCLACKLDHKLYNCPKFKAMSVDDRIAKVFEWQICSNCLREGHKSFHCRLGGCRHCRRKHNSILHKQSSLHYIQPQAQPSTSSTSLQSCDGTATSLGTSKMTVPRHNSLPSSSSQPTNVKDPSCVVSMSSVSSNQALLSTALVEVVNNNKTYTLKALLDSGSQSSFLTEAAHAKIGLPKIKNHLRSVFGLNNSIIKITEHCNVIIQSSYNTFSMPVKCYIIPLITDRLPQVNININNLEIPSHIQLADPNFYISSEIDMLLGADVFWDLLCSSRFKLGLHMPTLQETQLGWIVSGPMGGKYCDTSEKIYCNFSKELQQQLSKFWELEEVPAENPSFNEHYCEKLFNDTTYRDENGRFCVQIPLRDSADVLGDSYNIAKKRLLQIETKLSKNPNLRVEYNKFMNEYEKLGHMSEVTGYENHGCFLPYHAVIKESSETTKVRVVFNASSKTSNSISLNDIQCVGPVVQDDLFSILLRFRQHKFVVSADVEKMYRQILIQPEQRHLQMILWRDNEKLPIKTFQLNTVTYGTASAPFLSTRCLLQLSKECKDKQIAQLIKHDFYVDDFLSGSNSTQELIYIINNVTETLKSACFPLRKFRTNIPSIFQSTSNVHVDTDLELSSQSSALGLKWDPVADVLKFPTKIESTSIATKRSILSNSAKLFDPLGLLSACTIIPKIILQKLWLSKLDWDDPIPTDIANLWSNFVSNLENLSKLQIPRYTLSDNPETIELHAFCDASLEAYASCIYLRSTDKSGKVTVNLLCAKTKVSPVKSQTIPRLELCGALLSSCLASAVLKALWLTETPKIYYWTDSSVVLGWLSSESRDLQTFVANRVAKIQQKTSSAVWRHVPGINNPADLASRGLDPKHIQNATLWWQGPQFLLKDESEWPCSTKISIDLPERKASTNKSKQHSSTTTTAAFTMIANSTTTHANQIINFERFSNFLRLKRSLAYVLRFIHNIRFPSSKYTGHLSTDEIKTSLNYLIKQHQLENFEIELKALQNKKCLSSRSRLLSLRPFIDEDGILRVGGRIQNSPETYNKKHPILLDSNHQFTKLLFDHEHKKLMHSGPQSLLNNLRQTYWPIAGRRLARSTVNNCKLCRIMKASTLNPIMGNLPASRVTPNLPFQISGVDFAGPFPIRDCLGRGCKILKSYLCLFICLSTRAVHLELASDLSTDIFFLCLKRFISRKGKPTEIYCDNGRNFVGANNDLCQFLQSVENNESITSFAADEGIKFRFSPAYSPHFGGLWEAGIKSAKHHLYRMLGKNHFTYEELSTLFVQIEAILNSRPLTPLSSDPTDLLPLTPGHFLIGRPLTSLPSPALLDVTGNRLNRYQQIEQFKQHFWERWRHEFLSELQQRAKWRVNQRNILQGDMVVIKEANLPPLKWRLGRISKLYPGEDGVARVADVLTTRGIIRRAIHNLCLLPSASDEETQQPKVVEGGEDVRANLSVAFSSQN